MADETPWLLAHGSGRSAAHDAPEDRAGFFERYTFWWAFPTIRKARHSGHLDKEDLPALPHLDEPHGLFARCAAVWMENSRPRPSLLRTLLWTAQRRVVFTALCLSWTGLFCMTMDPILLHALLDSAGRSTNLGLGLLLVCIQSASLLCRVAVQQRAWHVSTRAMNNARSASVHAVFRRALIGLGDYKFTVGELTNFMATDADKFGKNDGLLTQVAQFMWSLASLPVTVFFLAQLVGWAAVLLVVVVIIIGSWANKVLVRWTMPLVRRVQAVRDQRASLMNELVRGIRTVKLEVWEQVWHQRIVTTREKEMQLLVLVQICNALNSLIGSLLSLAVPTCIFAWHVLVDGQILDATTAFVTLGWLSMLQNNLNSLPAAYSNFANLAPSVRRLDCFLTSPESTPQEGVSSSTTLGQMEVQLESERGLRKVDDWLMQDLQDNACWRSPLPAEPAIVLKDAILGYQQVCSEATAGADSGNCTAGDGSSIVLSAVNLEFAQGEFVVVAGPIGSGKSTLLTVLAGSLDPLSGECQVQGQRAYAAQKPFLLNASLRENVLFTLDFDEERYNDVIQRVALAPDLDALAHGDETQVGESGVQLSGGQRARVALARALYSRADVVICDDVLSAVDAHTAKHLWEHVFVDGFVAQRRTIILATHQVHFLSHPEVSQVVIIRDGKVWIKGAWSMLAEEKKSELASVLATGSHTSSEAAPSTSLSDKPEHGGRSSTVVNRSQNEEVCLSMSELQQAVVNLLQSQEGRCISPALIQDLLAGLRGQSEEKPQQGLIAWADFRIYLSAFGSNVLVVLLVVAAVSVALLQIAGNAWLSIWTSNAAASEQRHYLGIYIGIGVAGGLCSVVNALILTYCALRASRIIHNKMIDRLLRAPMSFFDRVATGRILNRFLQDMDSIDISVPGSMMDQLSKTLTIITQLSLIYSQASWILLSLPILIPPYIMVFKHVRISNRDAKRIEATAHSPVYAQFGESLAGRQTIRAYGLEWAFVRRNLQLVYAMSSGKYGNQAVGKWAQACLSQWSCLLFLVSGIVCVVLSSQGKMTGSQVGLVLLYAASLNQDLMQYSVSSAVLESQFVAVERVAEYTRLQTESPEHMFRSSSVPPNPLSGDARNSISSQELLPHDGWPWQGSISIQSVRLRYGTHLLPALQCIDLEIPALCKVAFCGRTGCGKSSLLGVLTRLYPLTAGRIVIDGHDISSIPLSQLRRTLSVVSQDAFLISGSILENLLPNINGTAGETGVEAHVDVCWHLLGMVGMAERVRAAGGLHCRVQEGGANFSVGERQLLTLARALLSHTRVPAPGNSMDTWRPPSILLADEATASVDLVADGHIHDVLLGLETTLIMVCHRLQYIQRFGLVAVLESGRVAECATPKDLLAREPPSQLKALCVQAGVFDDVIG